MTTAQHVYCSAGWCTFEFNGRQHRLASGDCMIIPSRGELLRNLTASDDFHVEAIYVTQEFIRQSTPQAKASTTPRRNFGKIPRKMCNTEIENGKDIDCVLLSSRRELCERKHP
ncbi:MAG: AraC family ligand binding domain-containing protein [Bacteroidaceae bacterium]|nr:AraC family ligand binding domain-containing protein [Bacteroidaceae bacterium]